jgi:hypothetical protein
MAEDKGFVQRVRAFFNPTPSQEFRGEKPMTPAVHRSPAMVSPIASGRSSEPVHKHRDYYNMGSLNTSEGIILPEFVFEIIPLIRRLTMMNPDVNQAFKNLIFLTNTGHKIFFDTSTKPEDVERMRAHLQEASERWGSGVSGADGIVSKMLAQTAISGAISVEAIVNNKLTGLDNVVMVNPETVRFEYKAGRYWPMQKIPDTYNFFSRRKPSNDLSNQYLKLNPRTFIYIGMLGDTDLPYGIPPYMSTMNALETQTFMMENIKHVVEQVGLVGFLQVLVEKPDQDTAKGESDDKYKARLEAYLDEAVKRIKSGMRNGVNVGFKEDAEFEFHNPTKNATGLADIFDINELQILSGLNMDGSLMGRDYSSGLEHVGIIFMKMLSEFLAIQGMAAKTLQKLYRMELTLAGFNYKNLTVEFNRSTLMDELKLQQGREILIRNTNAEYNMGIISQDTAADILGYERPDQQEPRVPMDLAGTHKQKETEKDGETERKKKKVRRDGVKDPDPDNKTRKNK